MLKIEIRNMEKGEYSGNVLAEATIDTQEAPDEMVALAMISSALHTLLSFAVPIYPSQMTTDPEESSND